MSKEEEEIPLEGVGDVRRFNKSFYVLIPTKVAKRLGIVEDSRWQLRIGKNRLIYEFPKKEDSV